ncbi:MAG TPA: ferric reductase-like transmembrane domain-containing protein [Gaiellaceae bacterium]
MTHAPAVWYLMRSTGIVALVLLTLSFGLGVANTNRWRPHGSRLYVTTEIHRYVSLLAVAFVAVHVATAVIDPDAQVRTLAAVWPFGPPFSLALGVLSLDLLAAVVLTSLGRRRLPFGAWRAVHWSAYAAWPLAFVHTLAMGTDAHLWWLELPVLACTAAMGALVSWRVLGPAV